MQAPLSPVWLPISIYKVVFLIGFVSYYNSQVMQYDGKNHEKDTG
jgi:hypothetical protein